MTFLTPFKCEAKGCNKEGEQYRLGKDTYYFCTRHAERYGFCTCCGGFYGGTEDLFLAKLCCDCRSELIEEIEERHV